jgi:GNAT superfamily N-acetyltransferase
MSEAPELDFPAPVLVNDEATLVQIQELRRRAWSANGEVPDFIARQDILKDEHDVSGMHWAVMHEGRPIAAARMSIHSAVAASPDPEALDGYEHLIDLPMASVTRLVVDPEFRGRGLPEALRRVRYALAVKRNCRSIVGVAEDESVMRSMEMHGFIRLGPTKIRYLSYAPSIVLLKRVDVAALSNISLDHFPIVVRDASTLLQIQELRLLAWSSIGEVPDFISGQNILTDEHDVHGQHWAVMHDGEPIASARMCVHDSASSMPDPEALDGYRDALHTPCAAFTRLAVHPNFRRRGLSKALDQIRIGQARLQGCKSLVSVTETIPRMRYLERLGFVHLGPTRVRYLSYTQSFVMLKRLEEPQREVKR